jgi:GNAT superfamily N-acetyltransferase
MSNVTIRPAAREDVKTLLEMIVELAVYEREPDAVNTTEADLLRDGFGDRPRFEALIAEASGAVAGFALTFTNYSTWEGSAGLYLEDLYVRESARGLGVGRALMAALAGVCAERGYKRLDLSVLDWNTSAQEFYAHLGMTEMTSWQTYRLTGEALTALGKR